MNIIRGSGLSGLAGIPPVRSALFIRPLIDCTRREILDYLAAEGLSFVVDSSNTDERFLRNRVRSSLLPELEERYNPAIREALCRLADVVRQENDYITRQAQVHVARWGSDKVPERPFQVPVAILRGLHPALQRRVILEMARDASAADSAIGFEHVQAVLDLAGGVKPGGSLNLPGGLLVKRTYGCIEFRRIETAAGRPRSRTSPDTSGGSFTLEVTVPGTVRIANLGLTLRLRELRRLPASLATDRRVYMDMDRISFPIVVRNLKPGDRIQPMGMKGTRKLKSVFIDEKIPREIRGKIPVVADALSILWVPGVRLSERVRVGEGTKRVLSVEII
jgi:tRNA(Ile)-lysidine synthase